MKFPLSRSVRKQGQGGSEEAPTAEVSLGARRIAHRTVRVTEAEKIRSSENNHSVVPPGGSRAPAHICFRGFERKPADEIVLSVFLPLQKGHDGVSEGSSWMLGQTAPQHTQRGSRQAGTLRCPVIK